jgi:adenine-specific DNA-methyltransferase
VHRVRELLDEIFGSENFFGDLIFFKAGSLEEVSLPRRNDYILWYCKDRDRIKFHRLYQERDFYEGTEHYNLVQEADGSIRRITDDERRGAPLAEKARVLRYVVLTNLALAKSTT